MKKVCFVFTLLVLFILTGKFYPQSEIPTFTDIRNSSGTAGSHFPYSNGAAFGDINNDGFVDLHVATTNGADRLFLNNGNLTFSEIRTSAGIDPEQHANISFGDFNNDGYLDILLTGHNEIGFRTRLYRNDGNLHFTDISEDAFPNIFLGFVAIWGDLNLDGWLDIISAGFVYLNNGDNTFTDITQTTGIDLIGDNTSIPYLSDTDMDGDLDLIMLKHNTIIKFYRNEGDLSFIDITNSSGLPTQLNAYADIDFGDIDNDGDPDLYISLKGYNQLFRNDNNNQFVQISSGSGAFETRSAGFADINNDGYLDIYNSNYKRQNSLFINNGNNTFTDITGITGTGDSGAGHKIAFGDIDNDGDLDLYIANSEGTDPLYLNNGTDYNWLEVKLIGTVSNRYGIGAKLKIVIGSLSFYRVMGLQTTHYSQDVTPVHFGIGDNIAIDYIEIEWPSGIIQKINNPSINQILIITEPTYGQISGTISVNSSGLENVLVKLLDTLGLPVDGFDDVYTDSTGEYSFVDIPEGDYQVMIVEPLGYASDGNPKTTTVVASETSIVDFNLTEVVVINQARSKGYWKHQFDVYVGNRGNAQESEQDLNDYITLVQEHYNLHYDIFTDLTTLEDWQAILSLKGNHPMADRAKQHLSALILNMVSNKIGQYTVVTDDGRDVGDVVQYVSELIIDGDDTNDELAKDLAESVNNQQTIAAGIVPEGSIVFKTGKGTNIEVTTYELFDNYPNPFNPSTKIVYQIPERGNVSLKVYDMLGKEVTTLVEEYRDEGRYEIDFDAGNLASGIYIYQLRVNNFISTKKMLLMK